MGKKKITTIFEKAKVKKNKADLRYNTLIINNKTYKAAE